MNADQFRARFSYDPHTGLFTRMVASRAGPVGSVLMGTLNHGYLRAGLVENKQFALHRLVFLWMTGDWPKADVDHIDGDRTNNRWANLRDVCRRINMENLKRARRNNRSTGLLGAYRQGSGFWSRISVNGKDVRLGSFDSAEKAHEAYIAAKRRFHEGNTL